MSIDAAIETTRPRPSVPAPTARASWPGLESRWVLAAAAAALWPVGAGISAFAVPGGAAAPTWSSGVAGLVLCLGLMVGWVHRPSGRPLGRWITTVLGVGVMGELAANAVGGMGRAGGLSALDDAPRALVVWLICVALYELTPIAAAAARITRSERRFGVADVLAHLVFLALAAMSFFWAPGHGQGAVAAWYLSPWMAAAIALPLAAARSGPPRDSRLPARGGRTAPLVGLAVLAWGLAAGTAVVGWPELSESFRGARFGVSGAAGLFVLWPALGVVLSLIAAATLLWRASRIRRAVHGIVTGSSDGQFTLEREGVDEPTWVAIDGGEVPRDGAVVTLIGARERAPGSGPFRDGATQWRVRRAWPGQPSDLCATVLRRAFGWIAWAGLSAVGLVVACM